MSKDKTPHFLLAILPILVLICLLVVNVKIYGEDTTYGSNQIALLVSAAVAVGVGMMCGFSWKKIQKGIVRSIQSALPAIIILLLIGALAGTWLISGVVPSMIYYGLKILNPSIFLFAACVISAIVAMATGSSWSTIATVGLALLGIGIVLDIYTGLVAGAIISGAYFGDKMSPLSDTTNLAPAMAGTDLFTHIRYMTLTTVPSISLALILFLVIGFNLDSGSDGQGVDDLLRLLESKFYISPWLFLVPVAVIFLIIKKVDAIPSLFMGTVLGGLVAIAVQGGVMKEVSGENDNYIYASYRGTVDAMFGGVSLLDDDYEYYQDVKANNEEDYLDKLNPDEASSALYINMLKKNESMYKKVHKLFQSRGMEGMMNTIWLIICAMVFGGVMEVCGLLAVITRALLRFVRSTGSLIATTMGTCVFFNATASDQYLAIVVPGRMFAETYRDRGLAPENLSRTLEDSGTVTSVLFPWNTCGAAQSSVLGVATGEYWMYCFFNLISPIMTVLYGYLGIKIRKLKKD